MKNIKLSLLALFALLGLALSVYLWNLQLSSAPSCTVGGCGDVLTSEWGKLFGQPVAFWGVIYYTGMSAIAFARLWVTTQIKIDQRISKLLQTLWILGVIWGVIFSAYLRYLEFFKIGAVCGLCWLSVFIIAAMALVSFLESSRFYRLSQKLFYGFMYISYKLILKPIFFRLDPENIHDFFLKTGNFFGGLGLAKTIFGALFAQSYPTLHQNLHGIDFRSPVGLSEGYDKNGKLLGFLPYLGFGFMQIGTVTPEPYAGNPKPRLWRIPNLQSLQVYYGLANDGVKEVITRLKKHFSLSTTKSNKKIPVGISVGSPLGVTQEYLDSIVQLEEVNDFSFYTVNISCPNIPAAKHYLNSKALEELFTKIDSLKLSRPAFVKMPAEKDWQEFDSLLKILVKHKVVGVVIANLLSDPEFNAENLEDPKRPGGLSGKPVQAISDMLIEKTFRNYGDRLTIIGVGGILTPEDAIRKIELGASLVQVITGLIFNGPQFTAILNLRMAEHLKKLGLQNITQLIGREVKK